MTSEQFGKHTVFKATVQGSLPKEWARLKKMMAKQRLESCVLGLTETGVKLNVGGQKLRTDEMKLITGALTQMIDAHFDISEPAFVNMVFVPAHEGITTDQIVACGDLRNLGDLEMVSYLFAFPQDSMHVMTFSEPVNNLGVAAAIRK